MSAGFPTTHQEDREKAAEVSKDRDKARRSKTRAAIMRAIASKRRERISKGFHSGGHAPRFEDGNPLLGHDPQHATVEANDAHAVLGEERFHAFPAPIRATCWPFDGHMTPVLDGEFSDFDERAPYFAEPSMMSTDPNGTTR